VFGAKGPSVGLRQAHRRLHNRRGKDGLGTAGGYRDRIGGEREEGDDDGIEMGKEGRGEGEGGEMAGGDGKEEAENAGGRKCNDVDPRFNFSYLI
jgi:hypothetical protein